jgi:hypothetical protein
MRGGVFISTLILIRLAVMAYSGKRYRRYPIAV